MFLSGRRREYIQEEKRKFHEALKKTAVLATFVLLAVCSFSAFAALVDNSTAGNLQGMLHLGFEITRMMIWFLIVLGGLALLAVQLLLMYAAGKAAYNK